MSEQISNKELAFRLRTAADLYLSGLANQDITLAAERLLAMPDEDAIGNLLQERLGFRCLDSCIQKAECWVAVCNLLDYLKPNWRMIPATTRKDSALIAIAQLAQQPTPDINTIKKHCMDFLLWRFGVNHGDSDLFDEWLKLKKRGEETK